MNRERGVGGERKKETAINSFLVILMSFYLLFIGTDFIALLLISHHDMNVLFCNFLVACCGFASFIKKLSLKKKALRS